jgi:hypothetical protein
MIGKLPVLGFSLIIALSTALSGQALAREPAGYDYGGNGYGYPSAGYPDHGYDAGYGHGRGGHGQSPRPVARADYSAEAAAGLRYSDLNRDGWVTLWEALDHGRFEFRRNDRDRDHILTRYEIGRHDVARDDWNRDGRVTLFEYENAVRAEFARFDTNRDGFLARHELGYGPPRAARSAGWWGHR